MINFRLVLQDIDVAPLLRQVLKTPGLWNADTAFADHKAAQGSILYGLDSIVLRYIKSSSPGLMDWNRPAFGVLTEARRLIFDLMRAIPGVHLGQVIISRLPSGETIEPHIDAMKPGQPRYWERYQVPLQASPGIAFVCGDERVEMQPGEAWWFDNQTEHACYNKSPDERISMRCDIKPF